VNAAGQPSTGTRQLAYSVIIEWENVMLAESARAMEMLRRLSIQIGELVVKGIEGETLVVRDEDDQAAALDLDRMLKLRFGATSSNVRVISVRAKKYYEKKNEGAAAAQGAILVFLDSDVIPEDHWLERILSAFNQPEVEVVAGSTYVEPTTLYARAFAAFWFFPPRSNEEGLTSADELFGNNIAFRRELFLAHPFPIVGQFRGQAGMLIRDLRERGVGIYLQLGSRCAHPPPNGFVHFARRAMCDGHDNIVFALRSTGRSRLPWRYSYWSARDLLSNALQSIRERYRAVGLTPASAAAATLIAFGYVLCMGVGEVLTRWDPTLVPRRFSI
jgi:hypothetical protein